MLIGLNAFHFAPHYFLFIRFCIRKRWNPENPEPGTPKHVFHSNKLQSCFRFNFILSIAYTWQTHGQTTSFYPCCCYSLCMQYAMDGNVPLVGHAQEFPWNYAMMCGAPCTECSEWFSTTISWLAKAQNASLAFNPISAHSSIHQIEWRNGMWIKCE